MIHHYITKYWEDGEHSHHEEIRIGNGAELEERLKMMERKADEKPYDHCWDCELSAKNGGPCKVHDKYQLKRKILRALDFAALFMILLGGSAADWTPVPIVMAMILIPCAYIGLRQWAERTANE